MGDLLSQGQVVTSDSGQPVRVLKFLGGGSQGEVYKAEWRSVPIALKWYYQPSATADQWATLQELVTQSPPSDQFLWPEGLVREAGVLGFGYVMRLRPDDYKSLTALVSGQIQPTAMALIRFGINLTKAFRSLHIRGLCYRDISFGNAFFDPATGDVLVCDNDNVTTNRSRSDGVLGTPDFMAPELVRMEAQPSNKTDLHSLAVLLFYTFFLGHPLSGKAMLSIRCWDGPAREKIFGRQPVFIFDPNDTSNEALPLSKDPSGEAGGTPITYWNIYPEAFRNTFTKAFTVGVKEPDARITELEWLNSLAQMQDSLFRCACGTPNYYDKTLMTNDGIYKGKCWSCGKTLKLPFRIRIGRAIVMFNFDSKLYGHHLQDGRDFEYDEPVAEVSRHPTDPNIWGLKNLTDKKWVATLADGILRDIEPGRSVPLAANVKINFGTIDGEIRYYRQCASHVSHVSNTTNPNIG